MSAHRTPQLATEFASSAAIADCKSSLAAGGAVIWRRDCRAHNSASARGADEERCAQRHGLPAFDSANAGRHRSRRWQSENPAPSMRHCSRSRSWRPPRDSQQMRDFASVRSRKFAAPPFPNSFIPILLKYLRLGQNASTEKRAAEKHDPLFSLFLTFLLSRGVNPET